MPGGLMVIIAGPDGAGKSSLARELPTACGDLFRNHYSAHSRARVLPRPGALVGKPPRDPSVPHARPAYGRVVSMALLAYHWIDFLIGGWLRMWPRRRRSMLLIVERSWWDLAVDPRRYSLRVPARLVKALGRLLPKPDLAFLLEAPPEILMRRKQEISESELARQSLAWGSALPPGVPVVRLDATRAAAEVVRTASEQVARAVQGRPAGSSRGGWVNLGDGATPRWTLPRAPRAVARRSLLIQQPVSGPQRARWEVARALASVGGFRLLAPGQAPPGAASDALAPYVKSTSRVAVATANHPGRFTALLLDEAERSFHVAKIATSAEGRLALEREANAILGLAPTLPAPLFAPRVLTSDDGLLLLDGEEWVPRAHPWRLPEAVGRALGAWFRETAGSAGGQRGAAHGDCAPWNLLRCRGDRWLLIDWEAATSASPPFHDVFHFAVQSHSLLGRPTAETIVDGLRGRGWFGSVVRAYGEAAGIPLSEAPPLMSAYLVSSLAELDPEQRHWARSAAGRRRLYWTLESGQRVA